MAIYSPVEMDFSQDNIIMILSGLPGVGKTTLACSAEDVLIIDIDNGMKRVKMEHRKNAIIVKSYEELLEDLKNPVVKSAKTLVIDTGGALIELMKDWALKQPQGMKKNGGISLQGFGIVKSEFNRLSRELRASHNCILLFHTLKDKDKDGNTIFDIQCEGATKQTVWQPVDLGCYMQIIDNDRCLCFKPTQEYSAKKCYGVADIYKVPELKEGQENNFLQKLFAEVKNNISKEAETAKIKQQEYEQTIVQGKEFINTITDAETAETAIKEINGLNHSLTSKEELKHLLKAKLSNVGLKWNKELKRYE